MLRTRSHRAKASDMPRKKGTQRMKKIAYCFSALVALLALHSHCRLFALVPQRVILASNNHSFYLPFWPIVARGWLKLGIKPTLALIGTKNLVVDESIGDVIRFEPLPGVPDGFYAQAIRLLMPSLFPDEACILSDIDMLPLSKIYFCNVTQHFPEDSFIVFNDKAYGAKANQYPICYNLAKGSVFQEIFGAHTLEQIPDTIREWYAMNIGWITDEKVLYGFLHLWKNKGNRLKLLGYQAGKQRIDRSKWYFDPILLAAGYYVDSHMLRPYERYRFHIDSLLEKIGIL